MCEATEKNLYSILGAKPSDSMQQLKHRYQQLVLQYHPDRLRGSCPSETERAVRMFVEVDAAWKVLSDETSRRRYDQQRRAQELKQDRPVDGVVSLEDMTWDQDERVFTYGCRCGGEFSISEEEARAEEEEEEEAGGGHVAVCCDTCSLSVCVTLPSQ